MRTVLGTVQALRGRVWAPMLVVLFALVPASFLAACDTDLYGEGVDVAALPFPREGHSLLPPVDGERVSVGIDPQPVDEQPIEFNHAKHAGSVESGGMGMDCQYCHSGARKSPHAGVPSSQVCYNCHKLVDPAGRQALEKLKELCEPSPLGDCQGDPIPWVRVHDLPDFVHFNHAPHVNAGVACQECHGPMETRTVAIRDPDMTMLMGWCLNCHANHPSVETNYGTGAELRRAELKDCYTCHK